MKVSKKIVSIALALMLVLTCCISAFAVENDKEPAGSLPPGNCARNIDISDTNQFLGYLEFNNTGYRLLELLPISPYTQYPFTKVDGDYYISLYCSKEYYTGNFKIIIAEGTTRDVNIVFRNLHALKRDVSDFLINKSNCNVNIYFEGDNVIKLDKYTQEGSNERPWMDGIVNRADGTVKFYSLNNSLDDHFTIIYMFGCGLMRGGYEFNGGTVTLVQDRSNNHFLYDEERDWIYTDGIITSNGTVTVNDGKVVCIRASLKDLRVNGGELIIDNDMLPAYKVEGSVINTEEYKNKTKAAKTTALKMDNNGTIAVIGGTLTVTGGDYDVGL